jgi:hypothetical protein
LKEELLAIIRRLDFNGDLTISFPEFNEGISPIGIDI